MGCGYWVGFLPFAFIVKLDLSLIRLISYLISN